MLSPNPSRNVAWIAHRDPRSCREGTMNEESQPTEEQEPEQQVPELYPMEREKLKIFISHRHDDAHIAEVLEAQLLTWGFARDQIWRSSRPGSGVTPGSALAEDIRGFLFETNLVFYIYTTSDKNWEWCSYEVGVAEEPSHPTRVVTFQIVEGHKPVLHRGRLRVGTSEDAIVGLAKKLFKKDNFFPTFKAYWPEYDESTIESQAKRLSEKLEAMADDYAKASAAAPIPRWGFIRLGITGADLQTCDNLAAQEPPDMTAVYDKLTSSLRLVKAGRGGQSHFGYYDLEEALGREPTLMEMAEQWKSAMSSTDGSPAWVREIVEEIWRSWKNRAPEPSWEGFVSASGRDDTNLIFPLMTWVYRQPDGGRSYDVSIFSLSSQDPSE